MYKKRMPESYSRSNYYVVDPSKLAHHVSDRMRAFRETGKFCDITFEVDNQKFSAHKSYLATFSPYFEAMFSGDTIEAHSNEVVLRDVSPDMFSYILDYCYMSPLCVPKDKAYLVIALAQYMQISDLVDILCDFLCRDTVMCNVFQHNSFADDYQLRKMKTYTDRMISFLFVQLRSEKGFLTLNFEEFRHVVSKKDLYVIYEHEILDGIIGWVSYDAATRQRHLLELLQVIDWNLIQPKQRFHDVLKKFPDDIALSAFVMDKYPTGPPEARPLNSRCSRNPPLGILAFGADGNRHFDDSEFNSYYSAMYNIRRFSHIPLSIVAFSLAVVGKQAFIFGGHNDGFLSLIMVHENDKRSWRTLPGLKQKRGFCSTAVWGTFVYVCGGMDENGYLDTIEVFDTAELECCDIIQMPVKKAKAAVVVYQDQLIILGGGLDGGEISASVEIFNLKTRTWTSGIPLPLPLYGHCAIVYRNCLYIIGGEGRFATTNEFYVLMSTGWVALTPMNYPRKYFSVGIVWSSDKIIVGGGIEDSRALNSFESYDMRRNEWSCIPPCAEYSGHMTSAMMPIWPEDINADTVKFYMNLK